jgi:hypothetical protein
MKGAKIRTNQKETMKLTKPLWMLVASIAFCGLSTLTSCSDDDDDNVTPAPQEQVVINCEKPSYLQAGDKVALISPSYFTPMENVEKTADVLRSWGWSLSSGPTWARWLTAAMPEPLPSA